MPDVIKPELPSEQKKKIELILLDIFKDIYLNNENIIQAKNESDHISEEIKNFILANADIFGICSRRGNANCFIIFK